MQLESPFEQIRGSGLFQRHELGICKSPDRLRQTSSSGWRTGLKTLTQKPKNMLLTPEWERPRLEEGQKELGCLGQ